MAIERKDRSFDQIFEEITFEKVPMDYIESITILLTDGSSIKITAEEIANADSEDDILSSVDRDDIADIAIAIDYDGIKQDVGNTVKEVLDGLFSQD